MDLMSQKLPVPTSMPLKPATTYEKAIKNQMHSSIQTSCESGTSFSSVPIHGLCARPCWSCTLCFVLMFPSDSPFFFCSALIKPAVAWCNVCLCTCTRASVCFLSCQKALRNSVDIHASLFISSYRTEVFHHFNSVLSCFIWHFSLDPEV